MPRAWIEDEDGKVTEWRSKALPRYKRLMKKIEALIAADLPRRHQHATRQARAVRDVVSRGWRKVKVDWDVWCACDRGTA